MKPEVLNSPVLNKLHINEVRLFNSSEIPIINLSPGIAKRTQSILEMIDELLGSELNHKEEAILSLLNTFFVYCDGQCNIKSVITEYGSKNTIVYKFKKLVDTHLPEYHDVSDYARLLNISPKYLNECVREVLDFTAKGIIAEQLLMRSRHLLKFSDMTIKEISYDLGFSSPDYFSYFFKNHTGTSPSSLRKMY
jgi:AraC-like DNA-binding protein